MFIESDKEKKKEMNDGEENKKKPEECIFKLDLLANNKQYFEAFYDTYQ